VLASTDRPIGYCGQDNAGKTMKRAKARTKSPIKSASKPRLKAGAAPSASQSEIKNKAEEKQKAWDVWWEAHRTALKSHFAEFYKFDKESSTEFQMLKDVLTKKLSTELPDDDLKVAIGGVIYSGKRLYRDKPYKKLLVDVIRNAYAPEILIGKIYDQMRLIDDDYLEGCLDHVELSLSGEDKKNFLAIPFSDEGRVPMLMRFTKLAMQGLSLILSDITGNPEKGMTRSRPPIPYVTETARLMDVWHDLTGEDALFPKGRAPGAKGEWVSPQPSTEFVRLCLKMIDPKITLSNAQTLIKNARDIKKDMFG
jgi:hypothetical protein